MKILLTNVQLNQRTGTEIVVRDLEAGLRRRGHEVCVYTPAPGELAAEIVAAGGTVVSDLGAVEFEPDVIHGHHHLETAEALVAFPHAGAIFVCHDRTSPADMPILSPRIGRYVSVDRNCDERLAVEAGIPDERRVIVHNAVDLDRMSRRAALPDRPRRAAVVSNNATRGGYVEALRLACDERGISLDVIGAGVGASEAALETVLGTYDVVFAKARSALEAMAAGCAVVLVDREGLGSLVTTSQVVGLREWNFGARCLQSPVTPALVGAQLDRYDAVDAAGVTDWIREVADVERAIDAYLVVYAAAIAEPSAGPPTTWLDLHRALLQHTGAIDGVVRDLEGGAVPRVIPPTVGPAISMQWRGAPALVEPGRLVTVDVELRNRSSEVLSSSGLHPVYASYGWYDGTGARLDAEPERTPLVPSVPPGSTHHQAVRVRAPHSVGTYELKPDLVHEGHFWFSSLEGFEPQGCTVAVTGSAVDAPWTLARVAELVPLEVVRDGTFDELGFAAWTSTGMLTFGESERFVGLALRNPGTSAVIVTKDLLDLVPDHLAVAVADEPRVAFTRIHTLLATRTTFYGAATASWIDPSADVHPTAHVDLFGVEIGPHVTVGPRATISGRVRIDANASVGPGAIVGSAGFQTVEVDGVPTEMVHAGGIELGAGSVVFANAVISRGLFRGDTVVGPGARVGNGAFVSHNSVVGERTHVGHGAVVNGNVVIGARCWIGPGATITDNVSLGDGCRVSLGATVIGDVGAGEHLTGPPAVDHRLALRAAAELRRRR